MEMIIIGLVLLVTSLSTLLWVDYRISLDRLNQVNEYRDKLDAAISGNVYWKQKYTNLNRQKLRVQDQIEEPKLLTYNSVGDIIHIDFKTGGK